jgi:hypothetical protein
MKLHLQQQEDLIKEALKRWVLKLNLQLFQNL